MPLKCCTHYVSKFRKPSSGHKTGKGQSSSQFPRRAALKNAQTTRQLPLPPMLVRLRSKSFKLGFSSTWTENIQMFKLGLEKAEEFRDHIAKIRWITEKAREFQKLTTLKPWTVWIITNGGKLFSLVQFSSVTQLCLTLCNPMDHGTPDLPAHHQLPEFTQTHVHWVSDTIQPSHPLLSPSPAFNLSQHQVFSNELVLRIRWPKY